MWTEVNRVVRRAHSLWRRGWSCALALALLAAAVPRPAGARAGVRAVYVLGRPLAGDVAEMQGDYVMVQVQAVLRQGLGIHSLEWDPVTRTLTIYGLAQSPVTIRPGDPVATVAGQRVHLPVAPYINKDGLLMAPLDFFRHALGARVEWASATREVEITPAPWAWQAGFGAHLPSQRFSALAQDAGGGLLLAVEEGGATSLWLSRDGGATWLPGGHGLPRPGALRLWADPGQAGIFYAAPAAGAGLWSTRDGGATWAPVPGLEHNRVLDLAVVEGTLWVSVTWADPARPDLGLGPGLWHWDDAGAWVGDGPGEPAVALAAGPGGRLWAATGTYGGVFYRPPEGGWIRTGTLAAGPVRQVVAHPADPRWVWVLAGGTVYASQDGGATWQRADQGLNPAPAAGPWDRWRLVAGPAGEVYLLAGAGGVWWSPTGGGEWFKVTGYWPDAVVSALAVHGRRLLLATSHGGAVLPLPYRHPDARPLPPPPALPNWGQVPLPAGTGTVWALALDPRDPDQAWVAVNAAETFAPRLLRTRDGGQSWEDATPPQMEGAFPRALAFHPTQPGHLYALAMGALLATRDGGATWARLDAPPGLDLIQMAVLPSGRVLVAAEDPARAYTLYTDDLRSWGQLPAGGPHWGVGSLAADAASGRLYACDWRGCARSDDGGLSWQSLPGPAVPEGMPQPVHLLWHAAAPGELFLDRWVSRDGGANWAPLLPDLGAGVRSWVAGVSPVRPADRAALADTPRGWQVFLSRDGGATWQAVASPGPAADRPLALAFDAAGRLWLATGRGVWRLELPDP